MANQIKTTLFNLLSMLLNDSTESINNEKIHFNDQNIVETVIESVGKGAYRSIKNILAYLIPIWIQNRILNLKSKNIYLRISDLEEIKNGFVDRQGRLWKIYLYFSADWKMLALCLVHKAANANYFCLWCNCIKDENGNFEKDWRISKNIDIVNQNYINMNRHIKKPIFFIISLHNWIIDELHLLLHVWDRLWSLVIAELKATKSFDSNYPVIIEEMKRIKVHFEFWREEGTTNWKHTSLMEDDKLKSKGNFNSKTFVKGLYRPADITPYIHALVYHVAEFKDLHANFGMASYSLESVQASNRTQGVDINVVGLLDGTSIYDVDLNSVEDKPWRKPGADVTDYFNYGFNEYIWKAYCAKQKQI
ncbi:2731_t:CDS:2 [Gigaspora margarita]|uniref:2731_t:CDS:1 n=1 Tax=Gigaspora margarita TaxID=4874 RepID=A0ABN7WD19_GIGMA|nr:2731_t:CDS:2 [Gigaspora margarita]